MNLTGLTNYYTKQELGTKFAAVNAFYIAGRVNGLNAAIVVAVSLVDVIYPVVERGIVYDSCFV